MLDNTDRFLNENIRLTKLTNLLKSDQLKKEFELQVHRNVSQDIQDAVSTLIDWNVEKTGRTFSALSTRLARRQAKAFASIRAPSTISLNTSTPTSEIYASPSSSSSSSTSSSSSNVFEDGSSSPLNLNGSEFVTSRQSLLLELQNQIRDVMTDKYRATEASRVEDMVRSAILQTSALEIGAAGVAALTATALIDISGLLGAGALAVGGLYLLPMKRSSLKASMRSSIQEARDRLLGIVKRHVDRERDASVRRMQQLLQPYQRFVTSQQEKLAQLTSNIDVINDHIKQIRRDIRDTTEVQQVDQQQQQKDF